MNASQRARFRAARADVKAAVDQGLQRVPVEPKLILELFDTLESMLAELELVHAELKRRGGHSL